MAEEHKKTRKQWKSAVTRHVNSLQVHIADEDSEGLKARLDQLKNAFQEFETAHDNFHEDIDEDQEDESERYFLDVQRSYVEAVKAARGWLKTRPVATSEEIKPTTSAKEESLPQDMGVRPRGPSELSDIVNFMNLPKVELKPFDGNPMYYRSFIVLFEECVKVLDDDNLKLTRLLHYTTGKAYDAIQSCILLTDGYSQAQRILRERFGNDYLVSERIVSSIRKGKPVRTPEELQGLADELNNCYRTLDQMKCLHEVNNQNCIAEIMRRLQMFIQNRWVRQVMEVKRSKGAYPGFKEFSEFVSREAQEATDPIYGRTSMKAPDSKPQQKSSITSFSSDTSHSGKAVRAYSCVLCKQNHKLFSCQKFRDMKPPERLQVVNKNKLCENCFMSNHSTQNCFRQAGCSVPGCNKRHSKFIHINHRSSELTSSPASVNTGDSVRMTNASVSTNHSVCMPVVGVTVNETKDVCALLDTASSNSFISKSLYSSLGLKGPGVTYSLSTLNGEISVSSQAVNLHVTSLDGSQRLPLSNVYVIDNIPVLTSSVDFAKYPHFKGIQLVDGGQEVHLLIGQDNAEALAPLEVRKGKAGDAYAIRYLFGWAAHGPGVLGRPISRRAQSHFICATSLEDKVRQMWEIEHGNDYHPELALSWDDEKVLKLWNEEVKFVDGHFQLPIPWKEGATVPNNNFVATSRLRSLLRTLERKNLFVRYDEEVQKLLEKGYAERVPENELDQLENVWYLPHHPVISDKKPDKVRIVFDCAAKYLGESLNDKCLQGPDMSNKLVHVLLRFRQHQFAFMSDIESMYYQVRIPLEQRNVLRFLWLGDDGSFVHYRITGQVFGGRWCASGATFALRRCLKDCEVDEAVSDTVLRSFYVDDCLRSCESKSEIVSIIRGTRELLQGRGFNLTKFVVNDNDVLDVIPVEHRAKEIKDMNPNACSKALGIKWDVSRDEFFIDVDLVMDGDVTKRKMLSVVASIYDPLGFVLPFIISGKILLQEASNVGSWDERVPEEIASRWLAWLRDFRNVSNLRIPRCVKSQEFNDSAMELHVFSDASERAFGSCCYLRCVNKEGAISTTLLFAKSRVAPNRKLTIPRLELLAAVLSVQLESVLKAEMDFEFLDTYFWSDSQIVLKYISNDSRRFQVFVANRVSAIRQLSQPSQWNFIPGLENPADLLTRGQDFNSMDINLWLEGPKFLKSHKSTWSLMPYDISLPEDHPEVKSTKGKPVRALMVTVFEDPMSKLVSYHSTWFRLVRSVAWLLRLKNRLSKRISGHFGKELSLAEVRGAEVVILKYVQASCYSDELSALTSGKPLSRSSPIKDLCPFLDEDGIMRVGGRLIHAHLPRDAKHPCILPHSHAVSLLIARHFHCEAHLGTEWVISKVRERFWITRIRSVVKRVSYGCVICKKRFASRSSQKMADLPLERLDPGKPPFSYVGLDCFGPFLVKRGRGQVKRYGCIFTCLAIRAVHLEKLENMDTDSFLNAFRRFVSRRGPPISVWSDNGSNFVGGKAELDRSMSQLDEDLLQRYSVSKGIQWIFNPPGASHMGGVWERMIRTVRKVMAGLLDPSQGLSDDSLETLFCEVEGIINGRPITKLSEDVNDPLPLTPNHLLTMRQPPSLPPGVFMESDVYRRRWRCVQHHADAFWQRWLKVYVPELQRRSKWLKVSRNFSVGDLVLIAEENTPRGVWPMGIIVEVHKGKDDLVRSVKLRTKSTHLVRPITKIVLLEGSMQA